MYTFSDWEEMVEKYPPHPLQEKSGLWEVHVTKVISELIDRVRILEEKIYDSD